MSIIFISQDCQFLCRIAGQSSKRGAVKRNNRLLSIYEPGVYNGTKGSDLKVEWELFESHLPSFHTDCDLLGVTMTSSVSCCCFFFLLKETVHLPNM